MRNAFVGSQFHHLGVDQDHPDLLRGGPCQQRNQHGVHKTGLTRTGGAGDQQVRHLGQVRRDEVALDVLTETDHQRVMIATSFGCGQHVGQAHHLAVGVRHLDTDRRFPGDRGEQTHAVGGHRVGDIAL
ncbi:Uncharacterised protein [Mycobacteroides abscessus subsp. massiliense]|nr:Uncharacterised protein [Mycobacteroides abscessus subsp. massiliense]